MAESKAMTRQEWFAEGARRFGAEKMNWKFVCPVCGHVASVRDYKEAGAPESAVAFSCIGRWSKVKGKFLDGDGQEREKPWGPCDYAGGGLFRLNPLQVESEFYFDFAEPEAAA